MLMYVVGKGRIGGTWCDSFWCVNEDGTIGGQYARCMAPSERETLLADIQRHRQKLLEELAELDAAERILNTTYKVTPYEF